MDDTLEVVVDGVIYRLQRRGGISRLFTEILPRMCEMEVLLHITLLMTGEAKQSLPFHPRIIQRKVAPFQAFTSQAQQYFRSTRFRHFIPPHIKKVYERIVLGSTMRKAEILIDKTKGKIWHSTYFTLPDRWNGARVVTVYDMIYELFRDHFNSQDDEEFRKRKQQCIRLADVVICISETTCNDVQRFYDIDTAKVRVVPLSHSDVFRQLDEDHDLSVLPASAKPFIVYVGSRAYYKHFDSLLIAYSVWPRREEVGLVIVGGNLSTKEEERLEELGIRKRVYPIGDVDDETLCRVYNEATALVFPSLYEGFGIPLLEAMSCGCPIIASRIPSTVEIAGECAIYFEPTEVESLVEALNASLWERRDSSRVRLGILRAKGYSWDVSAQQTLDIYRALQ